ncbi:MAG TPA: hypothetical protein DCP06_02315 [Lachnospiraceae bacterium]|nr:hypothetical protein [Lachnospiraceae bacterium]
MPDNEKLLEQLNFESREAYDRAKKEAEFIRKAEETMDLTDGKTALKLYNKIVKEKIFSSVVGYEFLFRLKGVIAETGVADPDTLSPVPVREIIKTENDTLMDHSIEVEKYKLLYEGQKLINTKFKIALVICVIVLFGFVAVNLSMEYSVFTYFTNYKATMEEELINKYEKWAKELQQREDALDEGSADDEEDIP